MESEDYENLRHLIRNTENLPASSAKNSEIHLIYTFSSLDLNEFENYLKELPTRKSILAMPTPPCNR